MLTHLAAALLLAMQQTTPAPRDSTWRDYDAAARDARLRGDWAESRRLTRKVDTLLHGHPAAALALARASMHVGDTADAVAELRRYAAMGLYDALTDSALVGLRDARPDLMRLLTENRKPAGRFQAIATLPESDFVAEGVTYDASRREFLVASIRYAKVVRVANGRARPFIDLVRDGGGAALGIAADARRNRLWVSTRWWPLMAQAKTTDSTVAAIFLYDLATGALRKRFPLPRGGAHEPGDICVAPNGSLYVSDGREGAMYVARPGADSLERFVLPNSGFFSPQGCAVDPSGTRIFVSDYALGVMSVDVATRRVSVVPRPMDVAVTGIDGMILDGDRLIGVQNGVTPNRVIAMSLNGTRDAIRSVTTIARDTALIREPTHLVLVDGDVVFVMNSGSGLYDRSGALRSGERPLPSRLGRIPAAAVRAPPR